MHVHLRCRENLSCRDGAVCDEEGRAFKTVEGTSTVVLDSEFFHFFHRLEYLQNTMKN